jgi:hypothetical protein
LAIAVEVVAKPHLIDTSYRIYLAQHQHDLSEANDILKDSKGDIFVIQDTVKVSKGEGMSQEDRKHLLEVKKQLGVYMITKSDSTIYYGLWGFLDVRLGIIYLTTGTMRNDQYRHLTGGWYH